METTIVREEKGGIIITIGGKERSFTGLGPVELIKSSGTIRVVSVQNKDVVISFLYSDITTINGEAPPGNIDDTITLLRQEVFFSNATGGGGSSYSFHNGLVDEGGGVIGLGGGATVQIGEQTFNINDTNSDNGLNISEANGLYIFGFADAPGVFKGSELNVGHDDLFLDVYNAFAEGIEGNTAGLRFMTDGSGMFVEDLLSNKGLQNSGYYESNFTDLSLITKLYGDTTYLGYTNAENNLEMNGFGIYAGFLDLHMNYPQMIVVSPDTAGQAGIQFQNGEAGTPAYLLYDSYLAQIAINWAPFDIFTIKESGKMWTKGGYITSGDIEITDNTKGIILTDTTDDSRRRVTLTAGVLVVSAPL